MTLFADAHCHLYFNLFEADLPDVIQRALDQGVERMLIPGINLETSRQAIEICERFPSLYAAVGVHPNDALTWQADTLAELERLASHPRVVAIGEIGLDFYRDHAPADLQMEILIPQLELAAHLKKPVVIHQRQSFNALLPVLKNWQQKLVESGSHLADHPGMLHSFDGTLEAAREAAAFNFKISFSGPVTFKNAAEKQQIATTLPLESMLIETDAPFLAPLPHRGQRNEPAWVIWVAQKIADLQSRTLEEVAQITTKNADRLFGWRNPA